MEITSQNAISALSVITPAAPAVTTAPSTPTSSVGFDKQLLAGNNTTSMLTGSANNAAD